VYNNISEASRAVNRSTSSLDYAIKNNKKSAGYYWRKT
jgi:hypothetical protein